MHLKISCDLTFEISVETYMIFMLRPRSGANQWISSQEYMIEPNVPVLEFTDVYGNLSQKLLAPVGTFKVHTTTVAQLTEYADVAIYNQFGPALYPATTNISIEKVDL